MTDNIADADAFVPGVFVILGHLSPLSTVSRLLYFKFQHNVSQHEAQKIQNMIYNVLYRKIIFERGSKIEKEYLIFSKLQRLEKTFLDMRHERIITTVIARSKIRLILIYLLTNYFLCF